MPYLNNIIEQDHRFIKKITRPMKGFKAFHSASATVEGIEVAHMIRKDQFASGENSPLPVIHGHGSIIVAENRDVCDIIKICDKTPSPIWNSCWASPKSAMIGKKSTSSVDCRCCGVWAKKSYKTVYA